MITASVERFACSKICLNVELMVSVSTYVPGSVNTVDPVSVTGTAQTQFNAIFPQTGNFLRPDQVFSSNPRVIQMSARFQF